MMYITDHAKTRAFERFGVRPDKLLELADRSKEVFSVLDRKKSYDKITPVGPKKIVKAMTPSGRVAYFVVDAQNRMATVLTEDQAMNNFKIGKWTKS